MRFYGLIMFWNEFGIIEPQNLGSLLMKSSQGRNQINVISDRDGVRDTLKKVLSYIKNDQDNS